MRISLRNWRGSRQTVGGISRRRIRDIANWKSCHCFF